MEPIDCAQINTRTHADVYIYIRRSVDVSVCVRAYNNICVIFTSFVGFLSKTDMRPNYQMNLRSTCQQSFVVDKALFICCCQCRRCYVLCNHTISSIRLLHFGLLISVLVQHVKTVWLFDSEKIYLRLCASVMCVSVSVYRCVHLY